MYTEHIRYRGYACTRVCTDCSLALGDKSGGVQLVYEEHLLLGMGGCFGHKER